MGNESSTATTNPFVPPVSNVPYPTSTPVAQPIPNVPYPTSNPVAQPAPNVPYPTSYPVAQPVPNVPYPTSNPVAQPAPNVPYPTSYPVAQPVPNVPYPTSNPVAQPVSNVPYPTSNPVSQPAPNVPYPTSNPAAQPAFNAPSRTIDGITPPPARTPNITETVPLARDTTFTTPIAATSTTPTSTPKMTWATMTGKAKEGAATTTTTKMNTSTTNWTNLVDQVKESSTVTTTSTSDPSKPTLFTVAQSVTAATGKSKPVSSAYAQWYKYTKYEQEKREKKKGLWYMKPPNTRADTLSPTTSTLTLASARIRNDTREVSNLSGIVAIPSYQLRSTAVYSPPHGDRFLPGRNPLSDTETRPAFKYYTPEYTPLPTANNHTKATMYQMDTISRQTPLINQPFSSASAHTMGQNASPPNVFSRGIQTDLQMQSMNYISSQINFHGNQPSQTIPAEKLPGSMFNNTGFRHLPTEKTNNQPPSSHPPARQPPSILKNSSTVLASQDRSNPLSERTYDRTLEELRQQNKDSKDGLFRTKKVHLLEKNDPKHPPPAMPFSSAPPPPGKKASQSISRSERLFSSRSFKQRK